MKPVAFLIGLALTTGCGSRPPVVADDLVRIGPIGRSQVFDLAGYADEGKGDPYGLFDENALVDPHRDVSPGSYLPQTGCQPTQHPSIYFAPGRGSRIVTDLLAPYRLREIWLYDHSRQADSVWIATGSMRAWRTVAAFVSAESPGWKKIVLDDSTRYVMIRFSSFETDLREMVLYGSPLAPVPVPAPVPPMPRFTAATLDKFVGANYVYEPDAAWTKPFHFSRVYNFTADYDDDTALAPADLRFNMLHYGRWNGSRYVFDIDRNQAASGGEIWYSLRGPNAALIAQGFGDKDRPLDRKGLDPEDPASYRRHAKFFWNFAAFFGHARVDTALLSLSHSPAQSGRGTFSRYENGNEEDAWWVGDKYCSPMEYYAQSTADLDGDAGRLGDRLGIRAADPAARLIGSGLVELDTNRLKVYAFLCRELRPDKGFLWEGGIQYHHYATTGKTGITPEADSLRGRLAAVRAATWRLAPGVPCLLGENGYDKGPGSRQRTPVLPGYDAAQSQGIMLLRSVNAAFFSGFDAYILYWLNDRDPETDPRVYLTSGVVYTRPDGTTLPYPGWFYLNTLVSRLAGYGADSILSEGAVRVYKYRNRSSPDSVAYFVYAPSIAARAFSLPAGFAAGPARLVTFGDQSPDGISETRAVRDGALTLTAGDKPVIVFLQEKRQP